MSEKKQNIEELNFEEALSRLEALSEKLSSENVPLDDAIGLYEEGVAYFKRCKSILDEAGRRITVIEEDIEKEL
jgi:exodeoxyribonuclease VII small subunit